MTRDPQAAVPAMFAEREPIDEARQMVAASETSAQAPLHASNCHQGQVDEVTDSGGNDGTNVNATFTGGVVVTDPADLPEEKKKKKRKNKKSASKRGLVSGTDLLSKFLVDNYFRASQRGWSPFLLTLQGRQQSTLRSSSFTICKPP